MQEACNHSRSRHAETHFIVFRYCESYYTPTRALGPTTEHTSATGSHMNQPDHSLVSPPSLSPNVLPCGAVLSLFLLLLLDLGGVERVHNVLEPAKEGVLGLARGLHRHLCVWGGVWIDRINEGCAVGDGVVEAWLSRWV